MGKGYEKAINREEYKRPKNQKTLNLINKEMQIKERGNFTPPH